MMTVKDLINVLQKIEDKNLLIRVIETNDFDIDGNPKPNFWLNEIEVSELIVAVLLNMQLLTLMELYIGCLMKADFLCMMVLLKPYLV